MYIIVKKFLEKTMMNIDMKNNILRKQMKLAVAGCVSCLMLSACSSISTVSQKTVTDPAKSPAVIDGKNYLLLGSDGEYHTAFLNGVDLGVSTVGTFPGEFGISKDTYARWFKEIAEMNVNVIRVYVTQMPDFYTALLDYDRDHPADPLYLMQGVYMNEDLIAEYNDVLNEKSGLEESFHTDIQNAVDVIHGNAEIEKTAGNPGGSYTADVSQYTIGWILGIEWSADLVLSTNQQHPDKTSFQGEYVETADASPFECFLAGAGETAVSYEMDHYQLQRPVAFCNWLTTDPLSHPNEPNPETEDAVSVDVEHIHATDQFQAGFFASYHAYPYYPEFLSYEPAYAQTDDPYLAYVTELNAYHSMPVVISEYGIPSSRGEAHVNQVSGMSQGNASEKQQAEWIIQMNQDIKKAGCSGAIIFSWQDEWFKRTWNIMDYELADRRPFWQNVECAEENFGLLVFDSGEEQTAVTIDGKSDEWRSDQIVKETDGWKLSASYDAKYVYLYLQSDTYSFDDDTVYIPIDTIADQGNHQYQNMTFDTGVDFLLRIHGKDDTELLTDAYYDVFQYQYAKTLNYVDAVPGQAEKDSGNFDSIELALNRQQVLPLSGTVIPFEKFNAGKLHYGNGDPDSADYDSLSDFDAAGDGVEIRIPWQLLNVMDPSSKRIMADFNTNSQITDMASDGFRFGIATSGSTLVKTAGWDWDSWQTAEYHERLKESYSLLQTYFKEG